MGERADRRLVPVEARVLVVLARQLFQVIAPFAALVARLGDQSEQLLAVDGIFVLLAILFHDQIELTLVAQQTESGDPSDGDHWGEGFFESVF